MIAPFNNNASYRLTSIFGYRNLGNGQEKHNGIDLVSYGSKEVIAVEDGTVVQIVTDSYNMDLTHPRGNLVKVRNDITGYTVYYQHLESVSVTLNSTVKKGQVLGIEGNTGRVWSANGGTGIHLHFEVHDNSDTPISPDKVFDIYNIVGNYSPSDVFQRDESDDTYINNVITSTTVNDTKTESSIHYTSELNGRYEPIYKDLTQVPINNTNNYAKTINVSDSIDTLFSEKKENQGLIINNHKPYAVDDNIIKLESHSPQIVLNSTNIDRLKDNLPDAVQEYEDAPQWTQCTNKLLELVETIDMLSKSVEKRMVRLENIEATNMRYLYRLSSRININCVYYGGQSIYDKYLCIRCLDDNLVNDIPVSLDQCLNCSRYEPIEGQVYELQDKTYLSKNTIDTSIAIDDSQAARLPIKDYINNLKIDNYINETSHISKKVVDSIQDGTDNIELNLSETDLDSQVPDIATYKYDGIESNGQASNKDDNISYVDSNTINNGINNAPFNTAILDSSNTLVISDKMVNIMATYEGFAQYKYKDGIDANGMQMYSIGYGHQIQETDNISEPISKENAIILFKKDIKSREKIVTSNLDKVGLIYEIRQCELDALVSFTYNTGGRNSLTNAAIEYIKNRTQDNANTLYTQFTTNGIYYSYYKNGEKQTDILPALLARRKREYNIFVNGDYT